MSRRRRRRSQPLAARQVVSEASSIDTILSGDALDDDEHLYRRLTGTSRGDNLPEYKHERMLAIAKYLSRTNPTAHRLLTLLSDFILAEGVTISYRNRAVQEVVERHWLDPDNEWDRRNPTRLRRFLRNGEYLMPLFPNPVTGHMTIGAIPSERIKHVETDPENWERVVAVTLKARTGEAEGTRYTIVNRRVSRDELLSAENPALYWSLGNDDGPRGISILYPIADLLDLLDQFMFSEVERWFLIKAFIWRVTIQGATPEQLTQYAAQAAFQTPKPGGVVLQNEKISWDAVAPPLQTHDSANGMRFLRNHILGTEGIPEHFFAEGGDVNRAVGAVMAEPSRKRFTALQEEWRYVLQDVLQAQIDYAVAAGTLPEMVEAERDGEPTGELIPARDAVAIDMADMSPDETATNVAALQQLIASLGVALAEDEPLISVETARRLVWMLAGTLGYEITPGEEAARIESDVQAREERRAQMAPQALTPPVALQQRAAQQGNEQARETRNDGRAAD